MTRDEVIALARDAGEHLWPLEPDFLERFAALVAAHEREACAALCEEREAYSMPIPCPDGIPGCSVAHYVPGSREKTARECAAAIRSRT